MVMYFRLACATSFAALLTAQIASAEVTADDVWQNTRDVLATFGGEFTAAKGRRGNILSLSDMSIAFQFPFDAGNMSVTFPDTQLIENDDGTVSLSYPATSTYSLTFELTDRATFSGNLYISYENLSYIASGSPGDVTHIYSADKLTLNTSDMSAVADKFPDKFLKIFMKGSASGLSGKTRIKVTSLVSLESDTSVEDQNFLMELGLPDEMDVDYQITIQNQSGISHINLPRNGMDILNLAAAFRSGLSLAGTSTFGFYETHEIVRNSGETVSDQVTTMKNYETELEFDESHLKIDGSTSEMTVTIGKSPGIPFPFFISAKSAVLALDIPQSASSELQNFGLSLLVNDVMIPDSMMAMIDPEHALPNNPATFSFDLSGKVKNMIDWLDIKTVMALESREQPPIELHALTLGTLLLDVVGARLSGSGAATFDNTDLAANGGIPKPTGSLDLSLVGGNTLLDTLVNIGLVSEEQATDARLAIATITRPDPDAGKDTLRSELEINEQGHIMANGMRIK